MSDKELHHIQLKRRWPFKLADIANYYLTLLIPVTITLFAFALHYSEQEMEDRLLAIGIFLLGLSLAAFCIYRIRAERTFHFIAYTEKIRVAQKIIFRHQLEELDWILVQANPHFMIVKTKISLLSWGETITIVFAKEGLLFNSMSIHKGLSMDTDRINMKKLMKSLS